MKSPLIDKIALFLVAAVLLTLAVVNLCQPNRPTVSEAENRKLATWPEFSLSAMLDGSYFSDIASFFSDTFIARDGMVTLSKRMDLWKSFSLFYERNMTIIMDPNATLPPDDPDDTLPTLPPWTDPSTTLPTIPTTKPTEPTEPTQPTGPTSPTSPTVKPTEPVIPLLLDQMSMNITVGTSQTLTATLGTGYSNLTWSSSDTKVVTVTVNGDNSVTVSAVADKDQATADIIATVTDANGQRFTLACKVTVNVPQIEKPDNVADFLPNGMFIYNGAAYSQSYYGGDGKSQSFATLYDRYAKLFPTAQISVIPAPMATITISDPSVTAKISDEGAILDKMESFMPDSVNFVNLKNILREHADEYLYFKSDHHWTHRGAYYAYYAFVTSRGMTPTDISQFEVKKLNTKYIGSMASYTGDERVKSFYDTIEAYMPTKSCKMTINDPDRWGGIVYRNYCIATNYTSYLAFLMGDNAYTVINVPSNPQDKSILVVKDSFGNTFVPYLTEHYGNIYVVDPRYVSMDLYEEFKDKNLTDIVFLINLQSAANNAWYKYFYNAIA